jgi:hypothetical protein
MSRIPNTALYLVNYIYKKNRLIHRSRKDASDGSTNAVRRNSLASGLVCRVKLFQVLDNQRRFVYCPPASQNSLPGYLRMLRSPLPNPWKPEQSLRGPLQYLDILVCRVALFPVLGSQSSLYAVLQPHASLKPEQILATAEYFPLPRMFIIIKIRTTSLKTGTNLDSSIGTEV